MSQVELIETIRKGDLNAVKELIESGADVNERDEYGWNSLNHAAGLGQVAIIKLLLENGVDVLNAGRDLRSPYMIALAAGQVDAAKLLGQAEEKAGGERSGSQQRQYCAAFHLSDLRKFAGWHDSADKSQHKSDDAGGEKNTAESEIVFIHQDFTVTRSMWPNEDVIFNKITPEWIDFCKLNLGFKVPDDIDLVSGLQTATSASS